MMRYFLIALSLVLFLFVGIKFIRAGQNELEIVKGGPVRTVHVNQLSVALKEVLMPRGTTGLIEDDAGSLGTSTYKWKRKHVMVGDLGPGNVIFRMDYNAALSGGCGQGFMIMDGRQVTEASYNTEHGAGSWAKYIGSSVLENKYLPNMTGRYAVAAASTSQDGSKAITTVGDATANLKHTQNFAHIHRFLKTSAGADHQKVYNNAGTEVNISNVTGHAFMDGIPLNMSSGTEGYITVNSDGSGGSLNYWAGRHASYNDVEVTDTDAQLTAAFDVEPTAIGVLYCMRII